MSYLNDDEHRILLAALRREKEFCSRQLTDSKRCVAVVQSLEKKFYYDRFEKEIRDKVIEEFAEKLSERLTDLSDNATIFGIKNVDFLTLDTVIDEIGDMAEYMKEVGE